MQKITDYLTSKGWGTDLEQTIRDLGRILGRVKPIGDQKVPKGLSEKILANIGGLGAELLRKAFQSIGTKPQMLHVPVFIQRGGELELYVIPDREDEFFTGSEEKAMANLREGETLYRLNIYRLV